MTGAGSTQARTPDVPRLALTPTEAATAIGCSRDFFDDHVMPDLRVIRKGRKVLVAVTELQRWLDSEAALTLDR